MGEVERCIGLSNKLMNLCEIGLFHIVRGVSEGARDNYHEMRRK